LTPDLAAFALLAGLAVLSAILTLSTRHAVYSALFLVFNFMTIAVIFLLLHAPFIALIQVTVYAGAIMVLFLFVIMLLGLEQLPEASVHRWQVPTAIIMGLVLIGTLGYAILGGVSNPLPSLDPAFGSPANVGQLLFTKYLLPFEITSVLLLVAMVGAIFLSSGRSRRSR
jgi:NADH-quinone oxidoreductase subunit J